MKVLVIGGTLFIGRLLVEELVHGRPSKRTILHRKPKHDYGRKVENIIMADRNGADSLKEALIRVSSLLRCGVRQRLRLVERGTIKRLKVEATVKLMGNRLIRWHFPFRV